MRREREFEGDKVRQCELVMGQGNEAGRYGPAMKPSSTLFSYFPFSFNVFAYSHLAFEALPMSFL